MLTKDAPISIATQPRSLGFNPIFIASASTVLRVKPRSNDPVNSFSLQNKSKGKGKGKGKNWYSVIFDFCLLTFDFQITVVTISRMLRCNSESSVMGLAMAISQAVTGSTRAQSSAQRIPAGVSRRLLPSMTFQVADLLADLDQIARHRFVDATFVATIFVSASALG